MIPLTIAEVAKVTGGQIAAADVDLASTTVISGPVVTDSREVEPGSLFVARVGLERDGHDFARAAVDAGAAAVLAERPLADNTIRAIVVPDSESAFADLTRHVVDQLSGLTTIAVTGSSGKTTTKDLLAQVLEPLGPLVAPPRSYNSEIGVCLTATRATEDTRLLVLEMGARNIGHIARLCKIVRPDISVVLNVGSAHVGEFGSRGAIAQAKAELVDSLSPHGTAVLNADDQVVRRMAERAPGDVVMVGESVHADVRAQDVVIDSNGHPTFTLVTPDGTAPVVMRLVGEHQIANALAVAGVAYVRGMTTADIASGLSQAQAQSRWRMEVTKRSDDVIVINDAYNANPESTRAAMKTLVSMKPGRPGGRTWAVLGEMRELGDESIAEHDALGRLAVRLNVSRLIAVGDGAAAVHQGASLEGSWAGESMYVPDVQAAQEVLERELAPGDVVLVKSSRDSGLRYLGDHLVSGGRL